MQLHPFGGGLWVTQCTGLGFKIRRREPAPLRRTWDGEITCIWSHVQWEMERRRRNWNSWYWSIDQNSYCFWRFQYSEQFRRTCFTVPKSMKLLLRSETSFFLNRHGDFYLFAQARWGEFLVLSKYLLFLTARSPVFEVMFSERWNEGKEIEIPDIDRLTKVLIILDSFNILKFWPTCLTVPKNMKLLLWSKTSFCLWLHVDFYLFAQVRWGEFLVLH